MQPDRTTSPSIARHAATVIVVREAAPGFEVLMLRRTESRDHTSGAWVFPGGLVDAADRQCHAVCDGIDDHAASARLGIERGGLDYYVAAIRECFEEAGILFALDAQGQAIDMLVDTGTRLSQLRQPLHRGEVKFLDICREAGLRLAAGTLHYIAHWVTPLGRPKRFDTRFFLAVLPTGQSSAHDTLETVDHAWLRPQDALERAGELRLLTPQRSLLATLARQPDIAALVSWARSPRQVVAITPRLALDRHGLQTVQPNEPAWAELGYLDPQGLGTAWCELRPGVAVRLSSHVTRVTSDSGWNSYLIGAGDHWAVVDPGPDDERHIGALVAATPGRIERILLTDPANSPGAAALSARTGARRLDTRDLESVAPAAGLTLLAWARDPDPARRMFLLVEEQLLFPGVLDERAMPPAHDGIAWLAPARGFMRSAASAHASG